MSQELIYTSAPRGLKPGSRGFCTVVSSEGMAQNLAEQLEALSGYRHVFGPHDAQSHLNPILWSHLKLTVGGRPYHVLSRIADAGLDYTNRTNKFAHHVALDRGETVPAGPAWVLSQPGFMETAWDGTPRIVPAGRRPARADVGPAACTAWQAATGDAGWGGALAETALANRPAVIVYRPGTSVLPLVAESLALVPPDRRWDVTFCTYFTRLPPGVACLWRFVIEGTPEASTARTPQALVINLAAAARAPDSPWTEAARTGRIPPGLWPAAEPQVVLPVNRAGDVAELERELAAEAQRSRPDRSASRVPPPRSTEPVSFGVAPPAIRSLGIPQPVGRAPDSGRFAPGAWRPKRRPWLVAAVVMLAIAGLSAGVFMSLPDNFRDRLAGSDAPPPGRNRPLPTKPAVAPAAESAGPRSAAPPGSTATGGPLGTAGSTDPAATGGTAPALPFGPTPSPAPTPTAVPSPTPAAASTAAPPSASTAVAGVSPTGATPNATSTPSSPPAGPPKPPAPPKFYYLGSVPGENSEVIFEPQGDPSTKWVPKQPNVKQSPLASAGAGDSTFPAYTISLEDGTLRGFQSKPDPLDLRMCVVDYDGKLHQFFEPVRFGDVFTKKTIAPNGQELVDEPISFRGEPPLKDLTKRNRELCGSRLVFRNASIRNLPKGYQGHDAVYWGDCVAIRIDGPSPFEHSGEGRIPLYLFAKASIDEGGAVQIRLQHAIDPPDWLREIGKLETWIVDAGLVKMPVSGPPPSSQGQDWLSADVVSHWKAGSLTLSTQLFQGTNSKLRIDLPSPAKKETRTSRDSPPSQPADWPNVENLRRIGWNPFDVALNTPNNLFLESHINSALDNINRATPPNNSEKYKNERQTLAEFKSYAKLMTQTSTDIKTLFGPDSKCTLDFDLVIPLDDEGKVELVVATTRDQKTRPVHVIPRSTTKP